MCRSKVVLAATPVAARGLQTLTALGSLASFATLAVKVGKCGEILRVVKSNRELVFARRIIAAIYALLALLWAMLLAQSAVHETTERVVAQSLTARHQTRTLIYLQEFEELVHDCSKRLRIDL
mmetsp:Transcript_8103/g.9332  ORF Transcript_8103/g.9332 Transcript_8103/m.9332 type:complete len:123 (-) Transcript_8103:1255-1623(-)